MSGNELLQLKGVFEHRRASPPGNPELPAGGEVQADHLWRLASELECVASFWAKSDLDINPLVSAYYTRVVAKSNRVRRLLSGRRAEANDSIVGARFYGNPRDPRHVITYCVTHRTIEKSVFDLRSCARALERRFNGTMGREKLAQLFKSKLPFDCEGMKKSAFGQIVRDSFYVDRFDLSKIEEEPKGNVVASLFKTSRPTGELLAHFGIDVVPSQVLDDTMLLSEAQFDILRTQAPFLVSMAVSDIMEFDPVPRKGGVAPLPASIPPPAEEPTIGIIDTALFEDAYFADWVASHNMLDAAIGIDEDDRKHGTAVSSIVVDGPSLNPSLDDGCGRFRVEHFAVAKAGRFSSFEVMRKIREIVQNNLHIKVWNLSLGSEFGVQSSSISPEAALLDRLQYLYDIVFVVAGTNKTKADGDERIGAPADSINSLVVNSVDLEDRPASYSRHGPVLSFFAKPDIAYYGGTHDAPLMVAGRYAAYEDCGTSLAAPWMARKMAYLMCVMDLPREVAKALVIDSATAWNAIKGTSEKGLGVPPRNIKHILYAPADEIRFVVSETVREYETFAYNLPVPVSDGKFPFIARATLCYFPHCTRSQGVDYTDTEISFRIGRIEEKQKHDATGSPETKIGIKPINNDSQDVAGVLVSESTARGNYRKWDNVKHVGEILKTRNSPRKTYGTDRWGIAFCSKERLSARNGQGMRIGFVVTLKELSGKNRIEEFVHGCLARGWVVTRIDMHQRMDLIAAAEAEVMFED